MPYVERGGVNIYYEAHGQGLPVLLSHGYAATSRMWEGQVTALADRYRLIVWDMRGHGESDSPDAQDAYSEEATVEDMAAILNAEGVDRAVIGGLSLGGYMSLAFYLKHRERVRALMLFDTGPGYRNPKGREQWNETAIRRAEQFEQQGLEALGRGAEVRVSRHRSAAGLAKAARGMLAQLDARVRAS
ncbi:MAG: alpha/beta fold hydrolase, partial [Chloroflexi bacterium]|nr:alpha/beta fold hydrolase [Chloroflexota bacterium]